MHLFRKINEFILYEKKGCKVHIFPSLFFIFHRASSMRKQNLINILPHRGSFVKDGKYWGSNVKGSTLHPFFKLFFMQNFFGLFIREFLLHFQACFNIVYVGYVMYENELFHFEFGKLVTIVNLNQNQQQPNCFVTQFIQKVLILKVVYTS